MVNIAVAGGTGDVAKEIVEALCGTKKHNVLLLSRKDAPNDESRSGVRWAKKDYQDVDALSQTLQGVHTVLSFIDAMKDEDNVAQKTLVEASIRAGVTRLVPSEWALSNLDDLPWYANKIASRKHLENLNKDKKIIEYCLFCPGIFTNYYTYPYPSSKHVNIFELNVDLHKRRALTLEGGDNDRVTLTTAQDLAQVVARAVEYKGEWPVMGGINGDELSMGEVIAIGEKIRGPFTVEHLKAEDLKAGEVKSSWLPSVGHHSVPREAWQDYVPRLIAGMLHANSAGTMKVSDEWNRLLPDYQFTGVEDFLTKAWRGKD